MIIDIWYSSYGCKILTRITNSSPSSSFSSPTNKFGIYGGAKGSGLLLTTPTPVSRVAPEPSLSNCGTGRIGFFCSAGQRRISNYMAIQKKRNKSSGRVVLVSTNLDALLLVFVDGRRKEKQVTGATSSIKTLCHSRDDLGSHVYHPEMESLRRESASCIQRG